MAVILRNVALLYATIKCGWRNLDMAATPLRLTPILEGLLVLQNKVHDIVMGGR
jgi:hypothetical protein